MQKKTTDVLPSSYVTHHRHCHHRHGFKSPIFLSECNPGQVVYTRLSVIKQYNLVPANGWWYLVAGEVSAGLAESNGSLPPGLWIRSPAGWLPRTGISSRTLRLLRIWDYLTLISLSTTSFQVSRFPRSTSLYDPQSWK